MRLSPVICGFCLSTCLSTGGWAADPTGTWSTEKGKAKIEIADCGGALCGRIVWLAQPNDPRTGAPLLDSKNRNEAKRQQPLVGVEIVKEMRPSGQPDRWTGRVYNPEDGGTYTAHITMKSDVSLRLEGCMMVICSGETWTRAEAPTGSLPARSERKPASR